MKHLNHYIHIATMIRKVKEAANRAYNIYAADHQTIESTFLSQRTERWHRGVKIK